MKDTDKPSFDDPKNFSANKVLNQKIQDDLYQNPADESLKVSTGVYDSAKSGLQLDSAPTPPANSSDRAPRPSTPPDRDIPSSAPQKSYPDMVPPPSTDFGRAPISPPSGSNGPSRFVGTDKKVTSDMPAPLSATDFPSSPGQGFVQKPQTTFSTDSYPSKPTSPPALSHFDSASPSAAPQAFLSAPQLERSIATGTASPAVATKPATDFGISNLAPQIPRPYQGFPTGDALHPSQALADSQQGPRLSWNEARRQALAQTSADGPAVGPAIAQRTPAGTTAVTARPQAVSSAQTSQLDGRLPSGGVGPAWHVGGASTPNSGRVASAEQPAGRSQIDSTKEGLIADGKNVAGKNSAGGVGLEPATRPADIKPSQGQIAYGLTPDGREHPFGLAGRLFEGHTASTKPSSSTNSPSATTPGDDTGRTSGHANPAGEVGAPGILGQIFDGHAGWKIPDIKSPLDDKKGKGSNPSESEPSDNKAIDGKGFGGRSPKGRLPDAVTMGGQISDGTLTNSKSASDKSSAPPGDRRSSQPTRGSAGDALVGIIESVKGGIKSGVRAAEKLNPLAGVEAKKGDVSVRRADSTVEINKSEKATEFLILTGVKTKPRHISADGSQTSVVAIIAPFISGANAGLKVTKDLVTKSDIIPPKIGLLTSDEAKPPVIPQEGMPEFFEQGRLKARPSVNLHLPGGKYANGKADANSDRQTASAPYNSQENNLLHPSRPWISVGQASDEKFDESTTVTGVPSVATHEALEPFRVPKAIDELEVTVEMEAQSGVQTVNERFGNSKKEHERALERIAVSADAESDEQLRSDRRYQYIVQPGDSIESIARSLLQDPMLAALLFNLNRRFILPEEQYGVHPLMVGAIIQLPTPQDILKFRQELR